MKKLSALFFFLLLVMSIMAQAQQGFNYQAVIRNAEGEPLQSQDVSLQISLLNGQDDILYSETHSPTTSPQGVVSITVGQGQGASSNFADIPWNKGNIHLKVEVDPSGGGSFTLMGISTIQAVPYALFALGGNQGEPGQDGVGIHTITHNANGTLTITLSDGESYTTIDITGPEGPQGPAGTGLNNRGKWTSAATYEPGDYVFDDSSDDPAVNSMWIVQTEESFTSTLQPKDDFTNWVEFQAPQGDVGPEGSEGAAGIGIEYQWQGTQLGIKREDEGAYSFADLMGPTGSQGEPGIPIQWLGEFPTHPTSPLLNQAYYNTSQGISFVYDGNSWEVIAKDGQQGLEGPLVPGTAGQTLRHNGDGWVASEVLFNDGALLGIGTSTPTERLEVAGNIRAERIFVKEGHDEEELLFAVRNSKGEIVLAVYETGVRVYVDDTNTKGRRSGFAVGGLSDQTKKDPVEYFRLTPDSVRFNINMPAVGKGRRSGFAVGGLSDQTKGQTPNNLLFISPDSARIYVDASQTKGRRSGFAVGGLSDQTKGGSDNFLFFTPENYFIGHQAGGQNVEGLYNSFIGFEAGKNSHSGSENIFIGYKSGHSNVSGSLNTFLGFEAGLSNTGSDNTFIGYRAGKAHLSRSGNVYLGSKAGENATHGEQNVFIGESSGQANTYGHRNVFMGFQSGFSNSGSISFPDYGSFNVFLGSQSGFSNTIGRYNVYLGHQSGYTGADLQKNVFIGYHAGYNSAKGTVWWHGSLNVFVGNEAGLANTTGGQNVALGDEALKNNTTGHWNIAIGKQALIGPNTGENNIAMGKLSLQHNTAGSRNIAIGSSALIQNTTGDGNISIGGGLGGNETGSRNIGIGSAAGRKMKHESGTVAIGNRAIWDLEDYGKTTAIGDSALYNLRTGSNNVAVGANISVNNVFNTFNNSTAVGYGVVINGSNQVRLGNSDVESFFCQGVYYTTTSFAANVNVSNSGQLRRVSSSKRYKSDIKDLEINSGLIYKLRPVSFTSNIDEKRHFGLIAEEVAEHIPMLVEWAKEKDVIKNSESDNLIPESVQYPTLSVLLLKELQNQNETIKHQQAEIDSLRKEIELIKKLISN